ncbi:MAG TPA: hypothetical protein VFM85_06730 [Actinomycetota bacterium]|nr:hypothetical protein [Actinomycetota bacterium]
MAGRALVIGATGMVLLTLGSSLGPMMAQAQAAPTLKVDPSSGGVGTTVRIAGRGFCGSPACSSVQVSFAGIVVADGIGAGSDGSFALSVPVPGGIPPGEKAVAATQTNAPGQQRVAITTFQVTLGGAIASPTGTATSTGTVIPTGTVSPTIPTSSATTVIVSPVAGGEGSSTGLTLAMVLAAGVFLTSLMGMAYVLWRSREVPVPPPPPLGPILPPEEVVTATHERPDSESPVPSSEPSEPLEPPESPKSPEPSPPSGGSGEGQTAG